jgi:hypothetical protein
MQVDPGAAAPEATHRALRDLTAGMMAAATDRSAPAPHVSFFAMGGTPPQALELAAAYRDAGVRRLNIAFREGPYDWEALHAFVEEVVRKV